MAELTLVSHHLCPYVQRAAIALAEKGVPFERLTIDLADKPAWFKDMSPLGKVPLLLVPNVGGKTALFESAVILEFVEETQPGPPLHPADPLARARHRAWIEFGSALLDAIGRFYSAPTQVTMNAAADRLEKMFGRIETELAKHDDPWFGGKNFSLVDAVFGPVFRYFDVFDLLGDFGILGQKPRIAAWRASLATRPSVRDAVSADYPRRLLVHLGALDSHLGERARRDALTQA